MRIHLCPEIFSFGGRRKRSTGNRYPLYLLRFPETVVSTTRVVVHLYFLDKFRGQGTKGRLCLRSKRTLFVFVRFGFWVLRYSTSQRPQMSICFFIASSILPMLEKITLMSTSCGRPIIVADSTIRCFIIFASGSSDKLSHRIENLFACPAVSLEVQHETFLLIHRGELITINFFFEVPNLRHFCADYIRIQNMSLLKLFLKNFFYNEIHQYLSY